MKVTMELLWHWRSQRYEHTTRLVVERPQALATPVEDLVELGVLLHARAQAMVEETIQAHNEIRKKLPQRARRGIIPPRTVLEAKEEDLPPALRDALLDMVKSAQDVKPLPEVERVRTSVRAGILTRLQELGVAARVAGPGGAGGT